MIHTDILHGTEITRERNCPVYVCPFYPSPAHTREINWPGKLQLMTHGRDEIAPTLRSPCFPDYSAHAIPSPLHNGITADHCRRIKICKKNIFPISIMGEKKGTEITCNKYVFGEGRKHSTILKETRRLTHEEIVSIPT